jgi:hypothetical protein
MVYQSGVTLMVSPSFCRSGSEAFMTASATLCAATAAVLVAGGAGGCTCRGGLGPGPSKKPREKLSFNGVSRENHREKVRVSWDLNVFVDGIKA